MICREHRCLFVHIPKTAGQSIEQFFLQKCGLTWKERGKLLLGKNADPSLGPPRLAHLKTTDYLTYNHISQLDFVEYFKFAFVRNPWDRVVSFYKYLGYSQKWAFNDFVEEVFVPELWKDMYWFVCPQSDYLCDAAGKLQTDFIGRFEALAQDFARVCEHLKIPPGSLPHINPSSPKTGKPGFLKRGKFSGKPPPHHRFYQDYYNCRAADLIAKLYQRDLELFDYRFDTDPAL